MKRKLILAGTLLLALVLTTGTYAYTYNIATSTLDAAAAGEEIVTSEPASEQPDWDDVLPESDYDTEYLLPNAAGDENYISSQFPEVGEHWSKVDEMPADDGETYVYNADGITSYQRDLYSLTNHTYADGTETITSATVYFTFRSDDGLGYAKAAIKTYGTVFEGSEESYGGGRDWQTRTYTWTTNPFTGLAWTWDEVDDLQVGISIKSSETEIKVFCTNVYVKVDYEMVVIEGAVVIGDLFEITPHPEYTGDLLVKVYLTNTANIIKAYQYLNMKLYVANSLEADKTPDYQVLSMENGVVLFNIEGGTAENYTMEVIGGGYRLISDDPYEWGEGWSVTPEFYCEVSQR